MKKRFWSRFATSAMSQSWLGISCPTYARLAHAITLAIDGLRKRMMSVAPVAFARSAATINAASATIAMITMRRATANIAVNAVSVAIVGPANMVVAIVWLSALAKIARSVIVITRANTASLAIIPTMVIASAVTAPIASPAVRATLTRMMMSPKRSEKANRGRLPHPRCERSFVPNDWLEWNGNTTRQNAEALSRGLTSGAGAFTLMVPADGKLSRLRCQATTSRSV